MADVFDQVATQQTPIPQQSTAQGDVFDKVAADPSLAYKTNTAADTGETKNDIGKTVIVPKEGESFADTMNRAIAQGKKTTPQDIQDEMKTAPGKAATVLTAAPVIGAVGTAALAGAGELGTTAVNVGRAALEPIKDAIVEELPYLKSSPALYVEHVAKQAVQWVMENPGQALSLATKGGIIAATAKMLLSRGL